MASFLEQLVAHFASVSTTKLDVVQEDINQFDIAVVDSSWVETVSYDPRVKALEVNLQDGSTYTYYNVNEDTYNKIINSGSPGRVINTVLKNGFHPFSRG